MSEMEPLGEEVELQRKTLELEEGTQIPAFLVDSQARLARLSTTELARHFADVVVAVALRGAVLTPREVLKARAETYPMSDESWHERVRPDLLRALRARGVELEELTDGEGRDGRAGAEDSEGVEGGRGPDGG